MSSEQWIIIIYKKYVIQILFTYNIVFKTKTSRQTYFLLKMSFHKMNEKKFCYTFFNKKYPQQSNEKKVQVFCKIIKSKHVKNNNEKTL